MISPGARLAKGVPRTLLRAVKPRTSPRLTTAAALYTAPFARSGRPTTTSMSPSAVAAATLPRPSSAASSR